ncbi:hypothetical protein P9112_004112 [Eukaryota sp. TZLM1-RC]
MKRKDLARTNEQYRSLLEQRNKLLQRLEAKKGSKSHLSTLPHKHKREQGFNVLFSGANAEPSSYQQQPNSGTHHSRINVSETRSKWNLGSRESLIIKTTDGEEVKVSPRKSTLEQSITKEDNEVHPDSTDPYQQVFFRIKQLTPTKLTKLIDFISDLEAQPAASSSSLNKWNVDPISLSQSGFEPASHPIWLKQHGDQEEENSPVARIDDHQKGDRKEKLGGRPIWLESMAPVKKSIEFQLQQLKSDSEPETLEEIEITSSDSEIPEELPEKSGLNLGSLRQSIDMSLSRVIKEEITEESGSSTDTPMSSTLIPSLPKASSITFYLHSTHGDAHWVGLSGIELFDGEGRLIKVESVEASPACVDESDPRQPINLIDDCPRSTSIFHQWLAPFTGDNQIILTIPESFVSLIRIWNYNASRIHSNRGVKSCSVYCGDSLVFSGEVAQAEGKIVGAKALAEVLLFAHPEADKNLLQLLAKNDPIPDDEVEPVFSASPVKSSRPITHQIDRSRKETFEVEVIPVKEESTQLPFTEQGITQCKEKEEGLCELEFWKNSIENLTTISIREILVHLIDNYGDPCYIGLGSLIPIYLNGQGMPQLVNSRHVSVSAPYQSERRRPSNLINRHFVTTNDSFMWLCPFESAKPPTISFKFTSKIPIIGFLVYGYNKSVDDVIRSVKKCLITDPDNRLILSDVVIRKPPGNVHYDYGQVVLFNQNQVQNQQQISLDHYINPNPPLPNPRFIKLFPQMYATPHLPKGMTLKFVIKSTHGDPYYVGLSGVTVVTSQGVLDRSKIKIEEFPSRLMDVDDCRIVENLLFDSADDVCNSWLTQFKPNSVENEIYLRIDEIVEFNVIRLFNYKKDESRGVCDFELLIDDLIAFQGSCPPKGTLSILFNHVSSQIMFREKENIYTAPQIQPVVFINDNKVISQPEQIPSAHESKVNRPKTISKR